MGEPSSYTFPVNTNPDGELLLTKPQGTTICGFPVRFVTSNEPPNGGETITSQSAMNFSISRISKVLARCARMYSTAGITREVRKLFGQSFGRCPLSWSTPLL